MMQQQDDYATDARQRMTEVSEAKLHFADEIYYLLSFITLVAVA